MLSQEIAALDKAIAKGKWFSILVVGVLFWGELARALCIYPVAGILFGWFDWVRLQRKRDRLRAEYYQPHNE